MGWKKVKEHYRIGHIVQVTDQGLCIGSPYIHNLIVLAPDGSILKDDGRANDDLKRYLKEFRTDPETLKRLLSEPDEFPVSQPVYTYEDGKVIEKYCEAYGWPNMTHDGQIQYDNTFSKDKHQVVAWAKRDLKTHLKWTKEAIEDARKKLADLEEEARDTIRRQINLDQEFPHVKPASSRYDKD